MAVISFYNSVDPSSTGPTSGNYQVSGVDVGSDANRKLLVRLGLFKNGTDESGPAVTAGGVAMRQAGSAQQITGSNGHAYCFELDAAGGLPSGSVDIIGSHDAGTYFIGLAIAIYNGVKAGSLDNIAQSSQNIAASNPYSVSVVTSQAGCWVVEFATDNFGGSDASDTFVFGGNSSTQREHSDNHFIIDSNGPAGAGTINFTIQNNVHTADWAAFMVSLAPAEDAAAATVWEMPTVQQVGTSVVGVVPSGFDPGST